MKKIILTLTIVFINLINTNCQNKNDFLNNFPVLQNNVDTIIETEYLIKLYYSKESEKNILDTIIALHYFFNNNVEKMHDIEEGYNADENTYIYTPYTKKVRPLYKKIIEKDIYLLCYGVKSVIYLAIYNRQTDKIENNFIVVDDSDDYGNIYTRSTIFPNNNIITLQIVERNYLKDGEAYYILSKIDYKTRKFIELRKIKTTANKSDNEMWNIIFEALGISETGELLEDTP